MLLKIALLILLSLFIIGNSFGQEENIELKNRKTYQITRINTAPEIDGSLNESVWKNATSTSGFVMLEPGDGDPVPADSDTEVKILYDDEAIYIGAHLKSGEPEKTITQFTQRDNIGLSEYFLIDINPYDDGENQTRFIVTAAGTIIDGKVTGDSEDYTFNTVWEADILHDDTGWYAEIKIPYSALRFPEKEIQHWAFQFLREISHRNETYTWNYVNKSVGKMSQYTGLVTGIKNIDPPVRLSLYPYTSGEISRYEGNTETGFSAGMDLKYGINDAFTLDATLIPDFGQVAFDDVELNLTPFEQQFGENRAFFTEGTELFTKGDLFYSRRVGDLPSGYNEVYQNLNPGEVVTENPERADLLNAFKISGRTEDNLGIGFFNAVTTEMFARVENRHTGETREILTEPFTNYNILVLDQQFNKNSSISLINTNVTRNGHFRDANVSGFLFDVFNRSNSFNFSGEAKVSQVNREMQNVSGFASNFSVNRTKGNIRYGFSHDFANETYDINDLGINFFNNYNNFLWNTSYQIFEPRGIYNRYNIEIYGEHQRRYRPDVAVNTSIGGSFFAMTRKRFAFGGSLEVNSKFHDFFESRKNGVFITYNKSAGAETWVSSDYRKTFAYDVRVGFDKFIDAQHLFNLEVSPRLRINDKTLFIYEFNYDLEKNRQSFVNLQNPEVIFGNRNMESIENSLELSYNLNTKQGINLNFRNFWSRAGFEKNGFTNLQQDGTLKPYNYVIDETNNPNRDFNIWNLDLSYSWQFAPGSEAILLYRNSLFNQDRLADLNFYGSLNRLFTQPINQILSLRIVYFVDYNNLKNIFTG